MNTRLNRRKCSVNSSDVANLQFELDNLATVIKSLLHEYQPTKRDLLDMREKTTDDMAIGIEARITEARELKHKQWKLRLDELQKGLWTGCPRESGTRAVPHGIEESKYPKTSRRATDDDVQKAEKSAGKEAERCGICTTIHDRCKGDCFQEKTSTC
jgi:hypothetical protein